MRKNPIETTNDYLEFLAGRRPEPPVFSPDDHDVVRAVNTLRSLRSADPDPAFQQQLKQRVLGRSPSGSPARSQPTRSGQAPKVRRPWTFWVPRVGLPVAAAAVIAVTVFALPPGFWTKLLHRQSLSTFIAREKSAAGVELVATDEDALGVAPTTSFTLRAKEGSLTLEDVREHVRVTPNVEFAVAPKGDNAFVITPEESLTEAKVYTVAFDGQAKQSDGSLAPRTYSWAYQVRSRFQVIGTLPRNQATGVSINTGIEVTFSAPGVGADDFAKHLTVSPNVDGRVEVHQRTLSFVPKQALKPEAVYTVTISKGLKAAGADASLDRDLTFRFETEAKSSQPVDQQNRIVPRTAFESARPDEPLVFSSDGFPKRYDGGSGAGTNLTYDFTVYRYPTLDRFASAVESAVRQPLGWTAFASRSANYSVDGLEKIGKYRTQEQDGYVTLGTGFSEGYYLADSTSNGVTSQIPFAISSLGAYTLTTTTDTLIWMNDLATGQALANATIAVRGSETRATTDADGLATFTTPGALRNGAAAAAIAVVQTGSREVPVLINAGSAGLYGWGWRSGYSSDYPSADGTPLNNGVDAYWSFLSTDRGIYQPTDTVNVWGVVRPRDGQAKAITAHLDVVQRSYEGRYQTSVVKSFDVTTTPTGTFLAKIKLSELSTSGYPEIVLSVGKDFVRSRSISVDTYRKPAYQVSVTPDRYAAINGQDVKFDVRTTFFDGTPMPNVALKEESKYDSTTADLTTDEQGQATYTQRAQSQDPEGHYGGLNVSLIPVEPSEGDIRGGTFVRVFPAAFQIDAETSLSGTTGTVRGAVHTIHPERATPDQADPLGAVVGEPRPNQRLTGKVIALVNTKVSEGQRYDFLLKQTVEKYRYESHEETREEFTVTTGSDGTFSRTFAVDPKLFYRIEVQGQDGQGNTTLVRVYLWSRAGVASDQTGGDFSLVDTAASQDGRITPYRVGDEVRLAVRGGDPAIVQRILYLTAQRGLRRHELQRDLEYRFQFSDDDVPTLYARAVIFTGHGFRELTGPAIDFDESSRALTVTVTPERAGYGPGETAALKVKVTDPSGQGRRARVNVSAVDEAVFAIDQMPNDNPLTTLYNWVGDGVLGSYVSHEEFGTALMAEGGGGGDGRIDFKDNALFTEVETDGQGNATASLKMPDNLTSWRVTAQAVTDDLWAGLGQRLVPVSRQLFVQPNFPSRVLSRDLVTVRAAAYGTAVRSSDDVQLTFSLPGRPGTEATKTVKAFSSATFDLPSLDPGDYQLRFVARAKGQEDVVTQTIHVVSSNVRQQTASSAFLDRGEAPKVSADSRTTVRLADADRALAYEQLWSLLWSPYARLDDTVAARTAAGLLQQAFGEQVNVDAGDPSTFLTDQGLALYAIGGADLEYGALAAADPGLLPVRGKLVSWFQKTVDDPKANTEQVAEALYGLAQLGEPVLNEVRSLLSMADLPDREKLTAGLALEALGAKEEARPVAAYLFERYGDAAQAPYVRLKLGGSKDEQIVSTARFSILAAGLNLPEQYGLLQYLAAYPPKDTSTNLERALAISRLLGHAGSDGLSVTYQLNGQTVTKQVGPKDDVVLSMSSDEAKSFSITGHAGNVVAVSSFSQPFDPSTANTGANLSMTRTYSVGGQRTTNFQRGDLVRVDIAWKKGSGALGTQFSIVDVLPTGLYPVTNVLASRGLDQRLLYPYDVEHNRVKFFASRDSFYYFARAAVIGTSVAEPPMIQALDVPGNIQYGPEQSVTVK